MPRLGLGQCIPAGGGLVFAPPLGPELLTNGDFASDTVWTKGTGWTIAAGQATCTTPGATSPLSQPIAFVTGRTYQMTIVISAMPAAALFVRAYLAASPQTWGAAITAAGTYTRVLTITSTRDTFTIDGSSAAIASIESVSLKLVL